MFKRVLPLSALLLLTCIAFSADSKSSSTPRQLLDDAAKVQANGAADITTLLVDRRYDIDAQGRTTTTVLRRYRVETQDGVEDWSSISAQYSPWSEERPQLKARVITPDGVEHVLDPKVLTDAPASDDAQEQIYDDNRVYQGPLPSVTRGAIVETEIVLREKEPLLSGVAGRTIPVGSYYGPVEKSVITIKAPASMPLKYVTRLLPNVSVKKEQDGDSVTYRFEQGRMEMLEEQEKGLPIDVPSSPYLAFATGASWSGVVSEYAKIAEPKIRVADVDALVKKAIKPGMTREQIIRTLFALLHENVRYTGVEFGQAAIVPAYPAETLKRGYGDCKDKAALLVAMLRAAGIQANLALLNAGPGEDTERELPAMDFDHAIVYVPGPPELWLDATASEYQVGPMPPSDAGRHVLVIREGTDKLVEIPPSKPEDDYIVEKREFFLAEYGPAKVVETFQPSGSAEADYRSSYANTEVKETREIFENYAKNTFLAEKMTKLEHSDASDMTKPFAIRMEMDKSKRGFTTYEDAVAAIRFEDLFDRLPDYLQGDDQELSEKEKAEKEQDKKPRTADYAFTPFVIEWQYRVVPPLGFKARALPENKTELMGPAKLNYNYSMSPQGEVLATIRFDTVKGRYTVAEAEAMKSAIRQIQKRDAVLLTFEHSGHMLMTQGNVAEGLKEYEGLTEKHPKEAVHRIQVANAMFNVGLCETARVEARRATELDPKSAEAYDVLASILEHDLVCRRFKKGFDFDGAVAAYKKSIQVNPDEVDPRSALAILYEHGKDGYQYSPSAKLDDAVAVWREVAKLNAKSANQYINNVLFDLMYARHFDELLQELAKVNMDVTHRAMALTAIAATKGSQAAIEQSSRITSDDKSRSDALVNAATFLMRLRMYPETAALMKAGSSGQADSAAALQRAEIFRTTKRHEDAMLPDSDPRSVVQKFLLIALTNPEDPKLFQLVVPRAMQGKTAAELIQIARDKHEGGEARAAMAKAGLPSDVLVDLVISNTQFAVDGDDKIGYRITVRAMGAKNQVMYVVKDNGKYMFLASSTDIGDLGLEALLHVQANDLDGARKWLDWARSDMSVAGGDDPLAGQMFPRLWTRGQDADASTIRAAALSLMGERHDVHKWIPDIIAARDEAKSDPTRAYMERVLSLAYANDGNFLELKASGLRLLQAYPTSDVARVVLLAGCNQLKDWGTINQALQARLSKVPDDEATLRLQAQVYAVQGKFEEANAVLKRLLDSGRGGSNDMNSFAWNQLLAGKITPEGVEEAQRGASVDKGYAMVHTLASVYAENGNPQEARQLVLGIMDQYAMDEPDDGLWYVFGRVAEAYGQPQAALACYKRVQWKQKYAPNPMTTYALTQKRMPGVSGQGETAVGAK